MVNLSDIYRFTSDTGLQVYKWIKPDYQMSCDIESSKQQLRRFVGKIWIVQYQIAVLLHYNQPELEISSLKHLPQRNNTNIK